jgi:hypothetical protein
MANFHSGKQHAVPKLTRSLLMKTKRFMKGTSIWLDRLSSHVISKVNLMLHLQLTFKFKIIIWLTPIPANSAYQKN